MTFKTYRITKNARLWGRLTMYRNGRVTTSRTIASDKRIKRLMKNSQLVNRQYRASAKSTIYDLVWRGGKV